MALPMKAGNYKIKNANLSARTKSPYGVCRLELVVLIAESLTQRDRGGEAFARPFSLRLHCASKLVIVLNRPPAVALCTRTDMRMSDAAASISAITPPAMHYT